MLASNEHFPGEKPSLPPHISHLSSPVMHSGMLDDISDRSDDELYTPFCKSQPLRSGYYQITTVSGIPLGRGKLSEFDPSLVVTLPRDSAAPKVFLANHNHPTELIKLSVVVHSST